MIRNHTYLILTEFVYVRLKGLVWAYNSLTNPNNLDKNASDSLTEIYLHVESNKPLVIDCKGISGITDHAWDSLFKEVELLKREVIFINFQKIEQKINSGKKEFCTSLKMQNTDLAFIIFHENIKFQIDSDTFLQVEKYIIERIAAFINASFYKYDDSKYYHLTSTPIYANGEFDSASIISNPESFFWTCLRLADEVEKIIQLHRIGGVNITTKILTVSLRSSPFGAAVALLLGLQLETVDHFGPILKNFEIDNTVSVVSEYIYVGDFTVGGTEIKISKTYAFMRNSKLDHAVVIGSLFPKETFREFHLHPLANLETACPSVRYSLKNPKL